MPELPPLLEGRHTWHCQVPKHSPQSPLLELLPATLPVPQGRWETEARKEQGRSKAQRQDSAKGSESCEHRPFHLPTTSPSSPSAHPPSACPGPTAVVCLALSGGPPLLQCPMTEAEPSLQCFQGEGLLPASPLKSAGKGRGSLSIWLESP